MPIRPENKDRYPKNWKSEIVPRIRERSGNRYDAPMRRKGIQDRARAQRASGDLFCEEVT